MDHCFLPLALLAGFFSSAPSCAADVVAEKLILQDGECSGPEGASCTLNVLQRRTNRIADSSRSEAGLQQYRGQNILTLDQEPVPVGRRGNCYIPQCGCPGAFRQSWCNDTIGLVDAGYCQDGEDQCSRMCSAVWCPMVSSPKDFEDALKSAVDAENCSARYQVAKDLFATFTDYDTEKNSGIASLGGPANRTLAWLTGHEGLSKILNDEATGCCSSTVSSLSECACRVARSVGLIDLTTGESYLNPVPPRQYVYAAVRGKVTNTTDDSSGLVEVLVPTWMNLLNVMGSTCATALSETCSPCDPPAALVEELVRTSYEELFNKYSDRFIAMGASAQNCKLQSPAVFAGRGSQICTDVVLARLYLCTVMDANPEFRGTGWTSGGVMEFVAIPSPMISAIQNPISQVAVLSMDLPMDGSFHCKAND